MLAREPIGERSGSMWPGTFHQYRLEHPTWRQRFADMRQAWFYWMRVVLVVVLTVAIAVWKWSDPPLWISIDLAILVDVLLRSRVGAIGRRLTVVSVATVALLGGPLRGWAILVFGVLAAVCLLLPRNIGAIKPRAIGVPRPDAAKETQSPVEATSDDSAALVDALDSVWGSTRHDGPREGLRAVHSHGSFVSGTLTLIEHAADQPWAIPLFNQSQKFDLVARFSNFWSAPVRDDAHRAPHGMAVRVGPRDGDGFDLVLVDIKRFPVATRDDFFGFLRRHRQPGRLITFWLVARSTFLALKGLVWLSRPKSYVTRSYHGLNTFYWQGEPVRYLAKSTSRRGAAAPGDPRTRLDRDLRQRLTNPISFEFFLVKGRGLPGHLLFNPLRAWPRLTRKSHIGTLTFDRYETASDLDTILFDPHRLPVGVTPSEDEVLMARRAAYAESYLRRCPLDVVR
jgi:catalase